MAYTDWNLGWLTVQGHIPAVWDMAVLGGRCPEKAWLNSVAQRAKKTWAADKGLAYCLAAQVEPFQVVGDFDSVAGQKKACQWLKDHPTQVERFPVNKDLTDFQLLLDRVSGGRGLMVTGFWGGRFDHAWSNVLSLWGSALRGYPHRAACDDREFLWILGPGESLAIKVEKSPKAVSLFALTASCDGVATEGLFWDAPAHLTAWHPYAISNKITGSPFKVSLSDGWLGLYLCKCEADA